MERNDLEDRPRPEFEGRKYIWIRQRLPLDLLALSEEIIEMPSLIQDAAEITAQANEIKEATKEDLERVVAEESEKLRNILNAQGKPRSETTIASQVHLSTEITKAQKELSKARLDAALWSSLVDALRRKDSAIRVSADLINSGWLTSASIMQKRREDIRNAGIKT